ncbi:34643_t:CDS:1, partial [Gigaspora margarita]
GNEQYQEGSKISGMTSIMQNYANFKSHYGQQKGKLLKTAD